MAQFSRWQPDYNTAVHGLARSGAIIHGSYQIGPGGYASDGSSMIAAAEVPSGTTRLYSTANGVFATAVSGSDVKIYKSTDGIEAYALKATLTNANTAGLLPLLIDCGSNRIILCEYASSGANEFSPRLFGSSDGGENWSALFTCTADAIRHFHGGLYDATNTTLYLFTGDDAHRNSIVMCNDVASLFSAPNTWKTRWGLDSATRATINVTYIVGYNSETYRCVNGVIYGDYIYYGRDTYGNRGGVEVQKIHRTTHAVTRAYVRYHSDRIWEGKAFQEIWMCGTDNTGAPILSAHGRPEATYFGDTKAHIYRLDHFGWFEEIMTIAYDGAYPLINSIQALGDKTIISSYSDTFSSLVGKVVPQRRTDNKLSNVTLKPGVRRKRQFLQLDANGWPVIVDGDVVVNAAAGYVKGEDGVDAEDEAGNKILLELE